MESSFSYATSVDHTFPKQVLSYHAAAKQIEVDKLKVCRFSLFYSLQSVPLERLVLYEMAQEIDTGLCMYYLVLLPLLL